MDRWMDRWKWVDREINGWMHACIDGWMEGRKGGWVSIAREK